VIVVLPRGKIALGKLIQAIVAGAKVVAVEGNFDKRCASSARWRSCATTRSRS